MKSENYKRFIILQSDIDKAINYHLSKNHVSHDKLVSYLNEEAFYSYCCETIRLRVCPYDGFRMIFSAVVDSLYCDKPEIYIKTIYTDGSVLYRPAKNNGIA